jgi:hypothetical protein
MSQEVQLQSSGRLRRWILWGGLVLSLLVIAGGFMLWLASPGPMELACKKLETGMTLEAVKGLVGEDALYVPILLGDEVVLHAWSGEDGWVIVTFHNGVVSETRFEQSEESSYPQRVRNRLRHWLGLGPPPPPPLPRFVEVAGE